MKKSVEICSRAGVKYAACCIHAAYFGSDIHLV